MKFLPSWQISKPSRYWEPMLNLAGVEIILNMREKMDAMQREFERFFDYLQTHAEEFSHFTEPPPEAGALVPLTRASALRRRATSRGQSS